MLAVHQAVGIVVKNLFQGVGTILPVDKVFRLQDGCSGKVVHRGAHHVVGVTLPCHINVGEVAIDDRVHIGSISLVGAPHHLVTLRLSHCAL